MSVVRIPDAGGDTITVVEYQGHYLPQAPIDVVKGMRDVTIRDDDIFICAYPKSGTHWVFEIARLLLAGSTDVELMEKDSLMLEFIPNEQLEKFQSPRLLNCHLLVDQLPKGVFEKKTKIIYIHRNPKDMAVSFYHHTKKLSKYYEYNGTWENYLGLLMDGKVDYGAFYKYLRCWEAVDKTHPDIPVLRLVYEDIKEDPLAGIKTLAKFLGVERTDEFYAKVQEKTNFAAMKASRAKSGYEEVPIMYRKGQVGDWKNHFTVGQNEKFDKLCEKELGDLNIKFRYTLP